MTNIQTYKTKFLEKIGNNINNLNLIRDTIKILLDGLTFPYNTDYTADNVKEEQKIEGSIKLMRYGYNYICTFANPKYNNSTDFPLNNKGLREIITSVLYIDNNLFNLFYKKLTFFSEKERDEWLNKNLRINSDIYLIVNNTTFQFLIKN